MIFTGRASLSVITVSDVLLIALFDGLPTSASRRNPDRLRNLLRIFHKWPLQGVWVFCPRARERPSRARSGGLLGRQTYQTGGGPLSRDEGRAADQRQSTKMLLSRRVATSRQASAPARAVRRQWSFSSGCTWWAPQIEDAETVHGLGSAGYPYALSLREMRPPLRPASLARAGSFTNDKLSCGTSFPPM